VQPVESRTKPNRLCIRLISTGGGP
jgi:hypothetical protein